MLSYVLKIDTRGARAGMLDVNVHNFSEDLEQITRRANASEITFYTVDPRGLEEGGMGIPISGVDEGMHARSDMTGLERAGHQDPLVMMARETGGLALINSNDFGKGLSRLDEDTSVYYSLGVTLSKVAAVGYQQVRVSVNRPGVTVRTRQGYSALTEAERAQDRVEATMKTNLSYSAIPVGLHTAPASRSGRSFALPISVTFPVVRAHVRAGRPEPAAPPRNSGSAPWTMRAGRATSPTRRPAFRLPSGGADAPLTYRATLRLRKGANRVVVNVRDKATGRMGTAKANVRIE